MRCFNELLKPLIAGPIVVFNIIPNGLKFFIPNMDHVFVGLKKSIREINKV